jgi:methionyl aminopeptidase
VKINPSSPARKIILKSPREIGFMREAGRLVARALQKVREMAVPGATTGEINEAVATIFRDVNATPLFHNYPNSQRGGPPFPAVICASVNEAVVHGIPNRRALKEGDILSVDTGARLNGWCGDAALTLAIGQVAPEHQRLLQVTQDTLDLAIRAMARCRTWAEVATLMEQYVKSQGMGVVEQFVGHGIGQSMHEEPQVPNFISKTLRKHPIPLEPGLVLAVEPMVCLGTKDVTVLGDKWTVVTKDRRFSAHFEHTVAMTVDGPRILTLLDD